MALFCFSSSEQHNVAHAAWVLALAVSVLLCLLHSKCADAQFQISALTPQETISVLPDDTYTVISVVASSLLDSSTPGMLWGSIPSDTVASICNQVVQNGTQSFSASVTYGGNSLPRNMQIQALGGCGAAGYDSADGVEAVLQDDDGVISALVCPQQDSSDLGCFLFDTGDDINTFYNQVSGGNNNRDQLVAGAGGRKLLGNCVIDGAVEGAGTGFLAGAIVAYGACGLGIDPFCDGIAIVIGTVAGTAITVVKTCADALIDSGCFYGDALVATSLGNIIPMSSLSLEDQVAVRRSDGKIAFSPIYAFGHADPHEVALFINLHLRCANNTIYCNIDCPSSRMLKLTAYHLAPTIHRENKRIKHYKRAKDFRVGDLMLVACDNAKETQPFSVVDIEITFDHGLYNPLTLEGNIIVDGVVASVHSAWFLDQMFDLLEIPHLLHDAYQVIMFPVVLLHRILGLKLYNQLYNLVDQSINIPSTGTLYGGHIAIFTTITVIFSILKGLKLYATNSCIRN